MTSETAGATDPFDAASLATASKGTREIHAYWANSRGDRRLPRRADFDPADVPHLLANFMLIDVEGVRPDGVGIFRYRVVGAYEVGNRGHNPTGRLVEDGFFAPSLEEAIGAYERARTRGEPYYARINFEDDRGRLVFEDSILLPYSEDGETVSQILVYSERRLRASETPR